mmetsp:Transcript_12637/g.38680  ORF Transcript_12637/g.38680 Transcript_12637/m.38680 type:complete len:225 (+) Transcript_12637:198-872(+)
MRAPPGTRHLLDAEESLHFDDTHPVLLAQIVTEMLFEKIDRVPAKLAHDLAGVVEMSAVHDALRLRALYLDGHGFSPMSDIYSFLVELDRLHISDVDPLVFHLGDEWCVSFQKSLQHLDTHDNGILLVEYKVREDLQNTRKHDVCRRLVAFSLPDALHICRELIEEVVDDVGREDPDSEVMSGLPCIALDLDIEGHDARVLRLLFQHRRAPDYVLFVHWANVDA